MQMLTDRAFELSRAFRRGEEGQGLAEYALILIFVAVACVAALTTFGAAVSAHLSSARAMF